MNKQEFHMFCTAEAQEFSIESAIILNNLRFWLRKNKANEKNIFEGKVWTYNSADAFSKIFPYMSKTTIWRKLDELCKAGKILKGCFNENKQDKTLWFCINEPEFIGLTTSNKSDSNLNSSRIQNEFSLVQNEPLRIQNELTLPYSKPDNKTQIIPQTPKKTFPAYGKGFVLEEQGATLKLLNQAAANTIVRYHEAVEKKLPSIEMTGYIFTEPFSIGLTYLNQKIRLDAVIEDLNVDKFDALKFEELFKHSKTVAHLGFLCFELYFSYLNMRKNDSFKSISGLVVM